MLRPPEPPGMSRVLPGVAWDVPDFVHARAWDIPGSTLICVGCGRCPLPAEIAFRDLT